MEPGIIAGAMAWLLLLVLTPEFSNVAAAEGLAGPRAGRAVFLDLAGDGRLSVLLDRKNLFIRGKDGRYRPGRGLPVVPDLALFADLDNDGDADCFTAWHAEPGNEKWVDHGLQNVVFLNENGRWRAVPNDFPRTAVHAASVLDFDRDGILDLFVGSGYVVYGSGLECAPDRLYRGLGGGKFQDVTKEVGLLTDSKPGAVGSSKPTYGVTHGDFDGDGWQDLWVCTYGRQWNHLWRSDAGKRFQNIAPATGFDGDAQRDGIYPPWLKKLWKERRGSERANEPPFRSNGNTFDCAIADFDNDGDMDCILAEITHEWAGPSSDRTSLLVNVGGKFERRAGAFARERAAGGRWNQGDIHCGWLDYDNDGLLDALIASSDYPDKQELKLYRQKPDHTFEAPRTFEWEGAGQISIGDYDRDGDLDILVGRSLNRLPKERREKLGWSCGLFRNDVGNKNGWLQVVCRGKAANRDGIGCRIVVEQPGGSTQTREIRGGLGHAGHNGPYEAHFGLGATPKAVKVTIHWPDPAGTKTVLDDVKPDQRLVVEQP